MFKTPSFTLTEDIQNCLHATHYLYCSTSCQIIIFTGKMVKTITHTGILAAGIELVVGMVVVKGELWCTAGEKGIIRIKINP